MAKNIWITGVSGFSGQYMVHHIRSVAPETRIIGIGRSDSQSADVDQFLKVDLTDPGCLLPLAEQEAPEMIFHMAAKMPPESDGEMWANTVGGTVNFLRAVSGERFANTRIVLIGSAAEYLKTSNGLLTEKNSCGGESGYGKVKWAQTILTQKIAQRCNLDVVIARTFNLIGPGLSESFVATSVCRQYANLRTIELKIGNTNSERDFIDIRDAVSAYWIIAQKGTRGEAYNVCSGIPTRIEDIISMVEMASQRKLTRKVEIKRIKEVDVDRVYGSNEKLLDLGDWEIRYPLETSIKDMLTYYSQIK